MSRNDEIEDFDFQDIFLALDRHIRYKIYSTSDSEASVPSSSSSITSARAACLLLTLRVSRTGSKIASFRSRGPAGPSLPWIQYLITDKDRKATTTNHIFEAWTLILCSVCHSGTPLLWSGFQLQYANQNLDHIQLQSLNQTSASNQTKLQTLDQALCSKTSKKLS